MNRAVLKYPRFAVHYIQELGRISISPEEFSLFKHGRDDIAKKYANEVATALLSNLGNELRNKRILLYSSPYDTVATSSLLMTRHVYDKLKIRQMEFGFFSIELGKIQRSETYVDDYGKLGFEERFSLIKNDTYRFDLIPDPDIFLIFIDDISVTGSHQFVVERLLQQKELSNEVCFFYFAALANSSIHPSYESELNDAYVNSVNRLLEVVHHDCFVPVTRTIKRILSLPIKEFGDFIEGSLLYNNGIINLLYNQANSNRYNEIKVYAFNYNQLKKHSNGTIA
jgi:hypothetical protein